MLASTEHNPLPTTAAEPLRMVTLPNSLEPHTTCPWAASDNATATWAFQVRCGDDPDPVPLGKVQYILRDFLGLGDWFAVAPIACGRQVAHALLVRDHQRTALKDILQRVEITATQKVELYEAARPEGLAIEWLYSATILPFGAWYKADRRTRGAHFVMFGNFPVMKAPRGDVHAIATVCGAVKALLDAHGCHPVSVRVVYPRDETNPRPTGQLHVGFADAAMQAKALDLFPQRTDVAPMKNVVRVIAASNCIMLCNDITAAGVQELAAHRGQPMKCFNAAPPKLQRTRPPRVAAYGVYQPTQRREAAAAMRRQWRLSHNPVHHPHVEVDPVPAGSRHHGASTPVRRYGESYTHNPYSVDWEGCYFHW